MTNNVTIHWFRQDLRITDNPSLYAAAKQGTVLPIYIFDTENAGKYSSGSASNWWLHHSLSALNKSLNESLSVYRGDPIKILAKLIETHRITGVYWNRCYEPWRVARDKKIKNDLKKLNIDVQSFNGTLLWEPWEISKKDGTPYKVFTPFFRKGCLQASTPHMPFPQLGDMRLLCDEKNKTTIDDLSLLPKIPWHKQLEPYWQIGEQAALKKLRKFLNKGLVNYKEGRNFPAKENVSRLSPHLHFGEISSHQVWYAAEQQERSDDLDHFQSELAWREFSYSLLYHFPDLPKKNLQAKFDHFPWSENDEALIRWQQGQTGFPFVDAGMRELWQSGYMHNRVRMVVGSFLVKNLLLHWYHGERWFWDCLVDADLANNSASWQWIAGCGADAAPYFRVFNPITQGQKFDASGEYTRRYVPELKDVPDKYLFNPWEAPASVLQQAGVYLGKNYPEPIVDVKLSRERALNAYQSIRGKQ